MSYLVAGHHGGLPNWTEGERPLKKRLFDDKTKDEIPDEAYDFLLKNMRNVLLPEFMKSKSSRAKIAFWMRMMFSCLVDADRISTEIFCNPGKSDERGKFLSISALKDKLDRYMTVKSSSSSENNAAPSGRKKINSIRNEILSYAREAAPSPPGFFSFSVPTGGGKTLSGMTFAIDHAVANGKDRIICVIPYTGIIEQTVDEFRRIFGEGQVVEHHSNVDNDDDTEMNRMACENWDAPIIVTTSVQFFESMYASSAKRCRKLHNIANSVILIDETQLIPSEWLTPCLESLKNLVSDYGATVILSTATQPSFPELGKVHEIIPDDANLYKRLKRIEIIYPSPDSRLEWIDVAAELKKHRQVMCIVNRKKSCRMLAEMYGEDAIHLSGNMCGENKSKIIKMIKEKLKNNEPLCVIATSLVEAGVDLDFPVVFREISGLDSIGQAGGRCNREGKLGLGTVIVFNSPESNDFGMKDSINSTLAVLRRGLPDLESPHFCRNFFDDYYRRTGVRAKGRNWIRQHFEDNASFTSPEFEFRTASEEFRIIDDQKSFIVPYGKSTEIVDRIKKNIMIGILPSKDDFRELQRYSVSVYRAKFEKMAACGLLCEFCDGMYLYKGVYSDKYGVIADF